MSCVNMTIPLDDLDAEALIAEAKRQERSFSGYIQKILDEHLENFKENKPVKRKVVIRRRKK